MLNSNEDKGFFGKNYSRPWPKKTPKNVPEARPEAGDTRQEFEEVGNSDTALEFARPVCHGELRRTPV